MSLAVIHLPAFTYLLREGDPSTCGFLIEQGSLEVLLERPGGNCVLAVLGPGEIVGEMALVDQTPRAASVRARENCVLIPITSASATRSAMLEVWACRLPSSRRRM